MTQDTQAGSITADPEPFDTLGFLIALAKHRRTIFLSTLVTGIAAVIVSLLLRPMFTATALVMPPQQQSVDVFSPISQFAIPGGSSSNLGAALGLKSQNDLYVGMLRSRTITDELIKRFELDKLYNQPTMVDTRLALDRRTTITATKEGLIQIDLEDEDPKRAAEIANAYVQELERLTQNLAISEAAQRRLFFEKRQQEAIRQLKEAEQELTAFRKKAGLVGRVEDHGKAIVETIVNLRVQIMMRESQVAGLKSYATDNNPTLIQTLKEIDKLKRELASLEKSGSVGERSIFVATGDVPGVSQEFVGRFREVKYREQVFEGLTRQLEQARIDEGKNPTTIQLVDAAVVPDKRTRPKRTLIVLFGLVVGLLGGCIWALGIEWRTKAAQAPDIARKLEMLISLLKLRRGKGAQN